MIDFITGGRGKQIAFWSHMTFRRALPWMGWAVVAMMGVTGLDFWYLSAQRLRLDAASWRTLLTPPSTFLTQLLL